MSRETYILIAFCVFAFLVGIRLKNRFSKKRGAAQQPQIQKNQRPKQARGELPQTAPARRDRSKTIRLFTILMMVMVLLLIFGMLPTLIRDIQRPGDVDFSNLFLRVLIFIFAILVFISSYIKLAGQRKKDPSGQGKNIKK